MKGSSIAGLVSYFGLLMPISFGAWNLPLSPSISELLEIRRVAQVTTGTANNRPLLKAGSQGVAVSELQAALKLLGYYTGTVDGVYSESTAIAVSQFQQAAGLNPNGIVGSETWERLFPLAPPKASSPSATTNSEQAQGQGQAQGTGQAQGQPLRAGAFPVPSVTNTTPPTPNRPATNTNVTNSKPAPASSSRSPTRVQPTEVLPVLRPGMKGAAVTRLQRRLQAFGLFKSAADGVFGPQTEVAVKAAQRRYGLKPDGIVGPATWKVLGQPSRNK